MVAKRERSTGPEAIGAVRSDRKSKASRTIRLWDAWLQCAGLLPIRRRKRHLDRFDDCSDYGRRSPSRAEHTLPIAAGQ